MSLAGRAVAPDELLYRLDRIPRVTLGILPTPLQEAPRLAQLIGVRRLFVKRDDLTGLGMGGNKVRTLEYSVADALEAGADMLVGAAYVHSNHCRQVAAAGARLGMDVLVMLRKRPGAAVEWQGNLLLDDLFGAQIELVDALDIDALLAMAGARIAELQRSGRRPVLLTLNPRARLLGALGAMRTLIEIESQLRGQGEPSCRIYVSSGGPTYAGLLAACRLTGSNLTVHGISNQLDSATHATIVRGLLAEIGELLDLSVPEATPDLDIDDRFLGDGYGIPSEASIAAVRTTAAQDGLVLDTIYTGKAMAGLMGHAAEGRLDPNDAVVFHHTGGVPGVFSDAELFRPTL